MQRIALLALVLQLTGISVSAQDAVVAANRFLQTLDATQTTATVFPFDTNERYNFHFVPRDRKGITFNDMNETQKQAAFQLMQTCLSKTAFQKAQDIMQLEQVLKELEKRKPGDRYRDPGNYHFSVFGIPSATTVWGWRFEGHHISFLFSMDGQKLVAGTPAFLGANPAIVQEGTHKGKEVLKEETESGFALLKALNTAQQLRAIADTIAPKEIHTFNNRKAMCDSTTGIGYKDLNDVQKQLLLELISVYVHRFTQLFADDLLKEIQTAGLDKIRFTWAGQTQPGPGHPHYYRVQGPTFIIEYDNTQNNGNHVHSVLRDLKHDFGGDALLEHYQNQHTR